ncbi:MAG: D-alanyl-D-alanine carboxypeptidase/D-alanyl-D-alanine-endopeptidase (Penicillin-binding protein 4) [Pseudonocardiales bacterium]|nr:D-alanyl-D-alanine carboxypeptidase/D-alanyl-D-alanine-endopeptidase (Penicillin-binding protein 4) [Pseudonocardiales bacterium]
MSGRRLRDVGLVLLVILLVAGAAAGGFLITHHVRADRAAAKRPTPGLTPSALASAAGRPSESPAPSAPPQPRPAAVTAALAAAASDPNLGGRLLAEVVDATTGAVLYEHLATTAAAPASTAKLLTAAGLLAVRPPTYRITTKVLAGGDGTITIVGGGDPTLTGAAAGAAGTYPGAARISDLAARLRKAHVTARRVVVDDSLFTGPPIAPQWAAEDIPSDYAAPITAVMADGGRAAPGDAIRSTAPDLAAGQELAAALGLPGAAVTRGRASSGARTVASVTSPPISELVAQMLQNSDNVIAECLARQVALATAKPASFSGAASAVRDVLSHLGADPGTGMVDGSGLAAGDRLSAGALAGVLRVVAGSARPALHDVVAGLPVAAWSGTLANRYVRGSPAAAGAGVVRAKTGTLTAVSTLAGLVHDADGRLLAFALLADRVAPGAGPTRSAEAALDRVAATLAGCGCR